MRCSRALTERAGSMIELYPGDAKNDSKTCETSAFLRFGGPWRRCEMKAIGTWRRSRAAVVASLTLVAILPGCDGGNDNPNTPQVTQPPALVRVLLAEGNFNLVGTGEASRR